MKEVTLTGVRELMLEGMKLVADTVKVTL